MTGTEKQQKDPRHIARLIALQYLFMKQIISKNKISDSSPFEPNAILEFINEKKYDHKLYIEIVEGVSDKKEEIDSIIQEKAPTWPIDQINQIDLILLRIAIWEGKYRKGTPPKVVINEAVQLAKEISADSSSGFINGVLASVLEEE